MFDPVQVAAQSQGTCWSNRRPEHVNDQRFFARPGPCTVRVHDEVVTLPNNARHDLRHCCAHLYHGRRGYMLSDLLKQPITNPGIRRNVTHAWARWADVRGDHARDFPGTLAANLVQQTDHTMSSAEVFAVLLRLVDHLWQRNYGPPRPKSEYLLVPLRISDVIEEETHSLEEIMRGQGEVKFMEKRYVRKLAYFSTLNFSQLEAKRAVILAGSHLPYASFNRSCVYVNEVRKLLETGGLDVELRCGHDVDDDVVVAARAKWITTPGGGFAHLLKNVSVAFGAKELPHVYLQHGERGMARGFPGGYR